MVGAFHLKTDLGEASYWLTTKGGTVIYRIVFAGGNVLFTNSQELIHERLRPDKPSGGDQLSLRWE